MYHDISVGENNKYSTLNSQISSSFPLNFGQSLIPSIEVVCSKNNTNYECEYVMIKFFVSLIQMYHLAHRVHSSIYDQESF